MKSKAILFAIIAITLGFSSACENNDSDEVVISYNGGDDSHKASQNCMTCHNAGGQGEGIFTVAGTVYNQALTSTLPNGTVRLHTGPGGTGNLVQTIEVDGLGNFFTTKSIIFGNGLYVSIQGPTVTKQMISPITSGQCNSCHGVTTDRVWTE